MAEPLSREDEAFIAALALRRQTLGIRCAIAVVGGLAFEPIIGTFEAFIWVTSFLAMQALEAVIVGRMLTEPPVRLPAWRRFAGASCLLVSHAVYGSLALLMWGHGIAGGVCSMLILAGGGANAVMSTAGSRLVLAATLAPILAYFALSPLLLASVGAGTDSVLALSMACLIFGAFIVAAYNQSQRLAESERRARRTAESRRAALEAAGEGKSAFMAAVGHDLRTPLSAILTGAVELGRQAHDANERAQAALIQDAGEMMNRLLDDLLDHSRLEAGRMEIEPVVFNLRDLLARSARFWQGQARSKGVRLVVDGGRFIPAWVEADPVRVRQILNNLLSNAVKFTDQGDIRMRLNAWSTEEGRCALTLEVADTDSGMDLDQQKRLFTAFDQTQAGVARNHGGSGLGMWISRGLAQLMGGRLTVRSEKGVGTAFTLALEVDVAEAPVVAPSLPGVDRVGAGFAPLPEIAPTPVPQAESVDGSDTADADGEADDQPLRVLVVDDHDINRRAVQLILAPLGCQIAQAENGRVALALAAEQPFDVIFMDVRMPELDGRETTRRLRATDGPNQAVPVIAVTADTSPDDVRACAQAGMTWFVGKPLTPATLLGALQTVLSGESQLDASDTRAA